MRIYYVNVNKKRLVGRCNQPNVLPLQLEYDIVENLSFQFIDDVNQIQDISDLRGLSLAIGKQPGKPSYDLLALSHDYTIEGNVLTFNVNTYTSNWLREIKKNNTEVYFEISQDFEGNKKVLVRDFCYAWPRVFVEGISPEIIEDDYYTKEETDAKIEEAISGLVPPSGDYATEEYVDNAVSGLASQEYVDTGLEGKQSLINDENKLAYDLLSGTPTIPTKTSDLNNDSGFVTSTDVETAISGKADRSEIPLSTSQLTNDSGFITDSALEGLATETYVNEAVSGKQDAITSENKLDYALVSGAPTVPTSTSQLTNDSGFVTSSDMETALEEKQDLITEYDWLPATNVHMDINHYPSDPDFTVEAAVNMTRDDVYAVSGVVSGLLSSKQDAITNDNKLDYSLISGTPSIPLSTSELVNDSDFATSGYVNTQITAATSGKLDEADYVAPYRLPYNAGGNGWLEEDIGVTLAWSDQDIIPNDRKIVTVAYSNNGDDHLVFPTLIAHADENVIKTCEVWIKMAGDTTEAQGIAAIVVPSSYYIVDESNFPTKLKGEATNNEAYTYHVFVIRAVPRQLGTLCEVCYSHFINTNLSI